MLSCHLGQFWLWLPCSLVVAGAGGQKGAPVGGGPGEPPGGLCEFPSSGGGRSSAPAPAPAPVAPANDLFSLDFHAPSPPVQQQEQVPKKDVKQDILSLFSTPAAPPVAPAANIWAQPTQQQQTSMMGSNGVGMWGVSSGWSAPQQQPVAAQSNLWGNSTQQNPLFNTSAAWGTQPATTTTTAASSDPFGAFATTTLKPNDKKDDVFGDLWGGFK